MRQASKELVFDKKDLKRIEETPYGKLLEDLAEELGIPYRKVYQKKWYLMHKQEILEIRKTNRQRLREKTASTRYTNTYWTSIERDIVMNSTKTDEEIAEEIGRSKEAVHAMRYRIANEHKRTKEAYEKKYPNGKGYEGIYEGL